MLRHLLDKTKNIVVTLRFSILSLFIILFTATIVIFFGISKFRFKNVTLFSAFQLIQSQSEIATKEITNVLNPALIASNFSAGLIKNHVLHSKNTEQIVFYTYHLLKLAPLLQNAYWADNKGNFIISALNEDGSIKSEIFTRNKNTETRLIYYRNHEGIITSKSYVIDTNYDPRVRPWYIEAKTAKKPIWSDVYLFHTLSKLGITAATPVYDDKNIFQGVFGIDIQLRHLINFIEELKVSPNGFSFIINTDGKMIAFPEKLLKKEDDSKNDILIADVRELSQPWMTKSLEIYKRTKRSEIIINDGDNTYLFEYKPIKLLGNSNWLLGVVVPKSDFTEELEKMHRVTYLICIIPLVLGIIILTNLVTRIVRPINYLVYKTDRIKHFELDDEIKIKSRIKEVIDLADAIRALQKGLRSFQKYVPKTLVKQLIDTEEDSRVGGVRKPLVVFFSDIKNFTAIAETIDANQLMNQMCDYFENLTQIVIQEKGTIDKYIGDSIMAFWGAPLPETEPCQKAANTAILCQKKLIELNKKWASEGKPPLLTRIGIHMGDAIIGNVGSTERLNYTAIGDTINMASRFENINKLYDTKIIVSDVVYEQIKYQFVLRMLDFVSVRGRKDSNYIYELMAKNKDEIPFDIDGYNRLFASGFKAYREQSWDKAIEFFKQCIMIFNADSVAPLFVKRCNYLKSNPPGNDWDGVWKIEE